MKRIAIIGVMILALGASILAGCTGMELTQEGLEQLASDVLVANAEVETVKFDINTTTTMEMIGGPEQDEGTTMVGEGTGSIDSANREMQIIMNIDVLGEEKQSIPMESYLVDGWMHIKVSIEEQGAEWVKMKMPEDMWDTQSQLNQQLEILKTAEEVNFLGIEDVNGEDCYVVEIVPGAEELNKMLSQIQLPEMEGTDMPQFNIADMIKEMSFKQWIAIDGYLIMKSQTHTIMEIYPGDVGATEDDFQKITADQSQEMAFYDYNEPVSIKLPAEALE